MWYITSKASLLIKVRKATEITCTYYISSDWCLISNILLSHKSTSFPVYLKWEKWENNAVITQLLENIDEDMHLYSM